MKTVKWSKEKNGSEIGRLEYRFPTAAEIAELPISDPSGLWDLTLVADLVKRAGKVALSSMYTALVTPTEKRPALMSREDAEVYIQTARIGSEKESASRIQNMIKTAEANAISCAERRMRAENCRRVVEVCSNLGQTFDAIILTMTPYGYSKEEIRAAAIAVGAIEDNEDNEDGEDVEYEEAEKDAEDAEDA